MKYNFVCFGEILFDVLPKEVKPGGAPMNVAFHLGQLGNTSTIISKIGNDKNGSNLMDFLSSKNINSDFIQVDNEHPTSLVVANPNELGDMQYDIVENVAWDYIQLQPNHEALVKSANFFIYGSLAIRNAVSRNTLFNLLDIPCIKAFDINLREPYIHKQHIEHQLKKTNILKMNQDELDIVSDWYVKLNNIEDKMKFLQNKFYIETLIVTRGSQGAVILHENLFYNHEGFKITVNDTIGSGDSFFAAFLSELNNGNSVTDALNLACRLGAIVATKAGGCPDYNLEQIQQSVFMIQK